MERLATWVTRHRLTVGLLWLVVTAVGVVLAPSLSGRLQSGNHVSGPGFTANTAIAAHYGGAASDPGVLILNAPPGRTVDAQPVKQELVRVDATLAKAAPNLRLVSYAANGDAALVGANRAGTIVLAYPPNVGDDVGPAQMDQLTAAAKQAAPDLSVHGTSYHALEAGNTSGGGNGSVLSELIVGALGALLVLAWVFGSFLALLPLIMALISVLTMQIFIYGLTYLVPSSSPINPAVQYIVALLGLGLSIDYSLLVVTRWREERGAGKTNDEAVLAAVKRAGHSVWFSGVVASLGLFALVVIPNSMVRGIGISGLFIPSTATLVALTLLPAILSKAGPRLDWPRRASRRNPVSGFWTAWSVGVIKHRVLAAVVGLGLLVGLAATATTINIAQPTTQAMASAGSYTDGLHALETDGFPSGTLTAVPIYVPHAADAPAVVDSLATVSSLRGAALATGTRWSSTDGSALVVAVPRTEVGSSHGGTALADIRAAAGHGALAGGDGAQKIDETKATYGSFPLLFAVVALFTFLLLARGMRSLVLPAKAVLLNMLSVAATYGVLVLVFQHGIGMQTLWGTSSYGAIDSLVPVLIFGFLFGVSMDYEVFILARIREGHDRSRSTREGIIEGVSRTGRLVTSAALILFFALASLSTANDVTVREIAAGLAAGVVLDAVVVRMLLLPALVALFGEWNWWLPDGARRLLRLEPPAPSRTPQLEREPAEAGRAMEDAG
ncbi:putative drug exporter of the RND superfamily [Actinacidiphila yanglinensis]|uniref:Putative drug exporter of the RND superfamily n=1 Tax=Actinacidiphila yanglinensis TaxID=310779 RepID=A0A1H6BAY5_9ACTN|nr:MMPL family transporter [Actinacidiphila yanglinensis]SEG57800.1 putative drug exporter of the RND superfamily [Actinacidiphila yanglinensis]